MDTTLTQETHTSRTIVSIDPGCLPCGACETTAPDVFVVTDDGTAVIRAEARVDGIASVNDERAALREHVDLLAVREAAAGCPVEVIKIAAVPMQAA